MLDLSHAGPADTRDPARSFPRASDPGSSAAAPQPDAAPVGGEASTPAVPKGWLERGYAWMIRSADTPKAFWIMTGTSFAEASVFPLPPDPILVPMMLSRPDRAAWLGLACSLASVLGALVGYALGAFLMQSVGQWLIEMYKMGPAFAAFHEKFNAWGAWIIVAKGLTPIPFKLVTIASGAVGLDIWIFLGACLLARVPRFLLPALLLRKYGAAARALMEKRLKLITFLSLFLFVAGIAVLFVIG